jgi:hypothetical protein
VILVAVSRVFQVDLLLSFHHGGRPLTISGVETVNPVRMDKIACHCCTSTRMAVPDPLSRTRHHGILHLAWLHVEGQGNNPVFFLLEAGPDRNKLFQVVHKSDDLAHEYDVAAPPTTTALTIYRGDGGLVLLSSGDTRTQMYDVRPSGVVPGDTLFVRWRERADVTAPGTRRSRPVRVWNEVIEVRFGCSVKDLKWQEEEESTVSASHEPPQGGKNGAHNILDHTFNGEGLGMFAKINRAAGHAALRAHARHQVDRDDVDAEVRTAMLDDEDATKIVNPPWSARSDFLWEGGARSDRGGYIVCNTRELLRGTVRHAFSKAFWLPRPNRPLPCAGTRVRTHEPSGTAQGHCVLRHQNGEDQVWLQREFVLVPNELKQVQAEHDGDMPDHQSVFAVMYPQFMNLINKPLHVWGSLHDPSFRLHVRTDQVQTEDAEKFGFTPVCVEGITHLRLNRSNLLCPLLYKTAKQKKGNWRSLDYGWCLQRWDTASTSECLRVTPSRCRSGSGTVRTAM